MNASATQPTIPSARVAHWVGCLLGTAAILLFVVFAIGNQPSPQLMLDPQAACLVVMLIGFVVAWWNDLVGGIVSLIGISCFYAFNYATTGYFPGGWVFPLCFAPGVLGVGAWLLRRLR